MPMTMLTPPDSRLLGRCADRRARLAAQIARAGGGVAIVPTAAEVMRNRDADYPFRHDSYFYYLTGFTEPQAALLLLVEPDGASQSVLFCRPRDAEREIWDGLRWGPEAARVAFGLNAAEDIAGLDAAAVGALADRAGVWWPFAVHNGLGARVEQWLDAVRAQVRGGRRVPGAQYDVCAVLDEMRLYKDADELAVMRRAALISADAHRRAMRACARAQAAPPPTGLREYHLEAELLWAFRHGGAQAPAYGSIVAAGANACILHYRAGDAALQPETLCLIDAACELDGYASDITRTFPVDGRFNGARRVLYDIVLESQQAAIAATTAGVRFNDPHDAALRVLARGLLDTGLVRRDVAPDVDAVLETGAYKRFYMHRTSHWIGMDVHDCGDYAEPGEVPQILPDGSKRPVQRVLRPGMALTIEPGLYVRAADDIPVAFHDIGIRIEDDVVVLESGCEVLTAEAPKSVADIEDLMRI